MSGAPRHLSGTLQRWTLALLLCLLGATGLDASTPHSVDVDTGSGRFEGVLVREAAAPSIQQLFRFLLRDPPDEETPGFSAAVAAPLPTASPSAAGLFAPDSSTWRPPLSPARRPQSPRAPPLSP